MVGTRVGVLTLLIRDTRSATGCPREAVTGAGAWATGCLPSREIGDWAERVLATADPFQVGLQVFGLVWAAHRYTLTQDRNAYERLPEEFPEPDDPLVRHARAFLYEDWGALLELAPPAMKERRRRGQDFPAELMETDVATSLMNLGRFPEADAVCEALWIVTRGRGRRRCSPGR
jgi:hypothetical protein